MTPVFYISCLVAFFIAFYFLHLREYLKERKRRIDLIEKLAGPPSIPIFGNVLQLSVKTYGNSELNGWDYSFRVSNSAFETRERSDRSGQGYSPPLGFQPCLRDSIDQRDAQGILLELDDRLMSTRIHISI